MKKTVFFLSALVMMHFAKAQTGNNTQDISKVFEFTNAAYDFGKIPFGKAVKYELTIKNISNDSASLDNVQPSCGCTTPEYEKGKKFGPGQSVTVTLGFSGNSMGVFSKYITIYLNGNKLSKQVMFKGETYTASFDAG